MDWLNKYKLVQYFSQHFYAKILVIGYNDSQSGNWTFWGINDYTTEYNCMGDNSCTLNLNSYSYTDGLKNSWNVPVSIDYEDASKVYSLSQSDMLSQTKCSSLDTDCLLIMNLIDKNGTTINSNYLLISSPKNTIANDPKLSISNVIKTSDNIYSIEYNVNAISLFVTIETIYDGYFDDNGLLLLPGNHVSTFMTTDNNITADDLKNSMYLYSLYEAGGFQNSPQS